MKNFSFLFFVPLQRMSRQSDITEMIKATATIVNLASTDLIDRIFQQKSERCLIVANGLDEWTPSRTKSVLQHVSYGLTKRDGAKHATVVTFSRPSAKGVLNMKCSECDQKVELLGIKSGSVICFIDKYLSKFSNTDLSYLAFMENMKLPKLEHLEKTPLLLQQLVWLYGFGYEIGKSVSGTYSHLVNIMLGCSQNKEEGKDLEQGEIGVLKQDRQQLTRLLCRFPKCEAKKHIILSLASVAFEALTSKTTSNTFGRPYIETRGVPEDAITLLIKFGILTEENCFDPTYDTTRLEFIQLSYLEFFAAVHVSSQYNKDQCSIHQVTVLEDLFRNCKSAADILQLSNVLKMMCGLSPYITSELLKIISDIISRDESMITIRNPLKLNVWCSPSQELEQIQRLMIDCLSEGDSDDQPMISLCDVIIDEDTENSFLQRIIPENGLFLYANKISGGKVIRWLVRLKRLQYLYIDSTRLSHNEMVLLFSFIQETPLRRLSLFKVFCTQLLYCEDHAIDLSKHDQLQVFELIKCHRVVIPKINAKHLEILRLGSSLELDTVLLLYGSQYPELYSDLNYFLRFTYNKQMDTVLHTLHQLRRLRLEETDIDTNALTVTPEMKNLEHIELQGVIMSLETWRTFVDSLLTLHQSVSIDVQGTNVCSEIDDDKGNYVRQNKMFEMIEDKREDFKLRTKK
ncbi:uncharacterized protein LOC128557801 [Mercenaria mercenaria]|uniref:uncharacterized protein LOC128557801 n=1 Tax=Mercenaria mercenaria TaxID=6596 RepID=UPI00234F9E42|nr:uncharacterized protein LOC128557801 [Mercenaria mercenaria]